MLRLAALLLIALTATSISRAIELEPGVMGEYFESAERLSTIPDFTGKKPMLVQVSDTIDFETRTNAFPGMQVTDRFFVRWTGRIKIAAGGKYTFYLKSDDGSRFYISDRLIIDNDGLHGSAEKSGEVELTAGYHDFRVEYFENGSFSSCQLFWDNGTKRIVPPEVLFHKKLEIETTNQKPGLLGEFYREKTTKLAGLELTNSPMIVRVDAPINFHDRDDFDLGKGFDNYVIRWMGKVHISDPGEYTFFLECDDGSILTLDGEKLIERDGLHPAVEESGRKRLAAGDHDLRIDYFQAGSNARLIMRWLKPQGVKEVVPAEVLFH